MWEEANSSWARWQERREFEREWIVGNVGVSLGLLEFMGDIKEEPRIAGVPPLLVAIGVLFVSIWFLGAFDKFLKANQ